MSDVAGIISLLGDIAMWSGNPKLIEKAFALAQADTSAPGEGDQWVDISPSQLAAIRLKVIEECAKIAESNDHDPQLGEYIATAIRALGREGD